MSERPTGTVTFLFTDIQGSTQLLHALRDQYALILADQRAILRAAFDQWEGREKDTQGEAFFVGFARATDAVNAVVQAQRNLAAHALTGSVTVRTDGVAHGRSIARKRKNSCERGPSHSCFPVVRYF